MRRFSETSAALAAGDITSEALVAEALYRADPAAAGGEGARVFIELDELARARARDIDKARARGDELPPHAGIPISIKDLFDVAGQVTRAGSVVLDDAAPASTTAPAIQRLLDSGCVPVGRTNMTEFAYSGVGLNPHYDTPRNPWDGEKEYGAAPC